LEDLLKRLEDIERSVNRIPTPLAYSDNLYGFRGHIDLVRQRLAKRLARRRDDHGPMTGTVPRLRADGQPAS